MAFILLIVVVSLNRKLRVFIVNVFAFVFRNDFLSDFFSRTTVDDDASVGLCSLSRLVVARLASLVLQFPDGQSDEQEDEEYGQQAEDYEIKKDAEYEHSCGREWVSFVVSDDCR